MNQETCINTLNQEQVNDGALDSISNPRYSNKQKIWQFALLYITTFGFYLFYWFYKNNKTLYSYNNCQIRPFLRTIGFIIPILNILLIWNFILDIKCFSIEAKIKAYSYPGWLMLALVITTTLMLNSGPFSTVFFLLRFIPLIIIQKTLNHYWEKAQPNIPEKKKLSWMEIIICTTGGILIVVGGLALLWGY